MVSLLHHTKSTTTQSVELIPADSFIVIVSIKRGGTADNAAKVRNNYERTKKKYKNY